MRTEPTMQAVAPSEAAPDPVARDAALMARIAGGDEATFRRVWDDHYDRVFRAAYGVLLDTQEAREVVQDCFVGLHRVAPRWRPRAQLTTWLTRVAVRDALRRRRRSRWFWSLSVPPAWSPPAPDEAVAGDQALDRLEAAARTLSPKLRAVLTLHLDQGLAPREIAEVLGISHGAARVALHRARAALDDTLSPSERS